MKRKSYGATPVKVIKTSISLPEVLLRFGEERCAIEGFNSFSSYLAHLVRMDKERVENKAAPKKTNPPISRYPDYKDQSALMNEPETNSPAIPEDLGALADEIIEKTEEDLGMQKTTARRKKTGAPEK